MEAANLADLANFAKYVLLPMAAIAAFTWADSHFNGESVEADETDSEDRS